MVWIPKSLKVSYVWVMYVTNGNESIHFVTHSKIG